MNLTMLRSRRVAAALVLAGLAGLAHAGAASASPANTVLFLHVDGAGSVGAPVTLYALSPDDLTLGAQQTQRQVATATTNSLGNATLTADEWQVIDLEDDMGFVNFEAVALLNGEARYVTAARHWNGTTWTDREDATGSSATMNVALAEGPVAQPAPDAPPMTDVTTAAATTQATAASASLTAASSEVPCYWYRESTGLAWTKVGEYHAGTDVKGWFQYGATADSDISAGYNYGSGYSLGGTVHIANSRTATVTWYRGPGFHRQLLSEFYYSKWHLTLGPSCTSSSANFGKRWYKVTPGSWYTGAVDGSSISGPFCTGTNRATFGKNTSYYRSVNRAYSYAGAVNAYGAGLTATSGYSSRVDMSWQFGSATSYHYLCGTPDITTSKIVYSS